MLARTDKARGSREAHYLAMTSAIPPEIAIGVIMIRKPSGSPSKTIPPKYVITGTPSRTAAALVARRPGSAAYPIA